MEACVSFVVFVAYDFQEFLGLFQSTELMIHLLYLALCKLMNALQRKFVRKIKFSLDGTTKNVYINVGDDRNIKPLSKIDVEAKAKTLLSHNVITAFDIEKEFRQGYLHFFVTAVQYLQFNPPYDVSLL